MTLKPLVLAAALFTTATPQPDPAYGSLDRFLPPYFLGDGSTLYLPGTPGTKPQNFETWAWLPGYSKWVELSRPERDDHFGAGGKFWRVHVIGDCAYPAGCYPQPSSPPPSWRPVITPETWWGNPLVKEQWLFNQLYVPRFRLGD